MKKTTPAHFLMLVLVISIACGIPAPHSDPFYSAWVEWGAWRFPLIKPYEVYFVAEGFDWWMIDLDYGLLYEPSSEMLFYMDIVDVRKVAVQSGVIMIYTPYEQKMDDIGTQKVLYWFVIIPSETEDVNDDITMGFDKESDFLQFVQEHGIENVTWETPEEINRRFVTTGCLKWIPRCN